MAQRLIAGTTSYENQSLSDIVDDIIQWIDYSEKVKRHVATELCKLKSLEFYKQIPYDYKAIIHDMPRICQTNIEDLQRTLYAINNHALATKIVELFRKIGIRASENSEENKKYYQSGYWHDYGNSEFQVVQDIYKTFGNYCASLWDVTNAASRLEDYVDIPEEITTMKYENNSINFGNNNKVKKCNFHSRNKEDNSHKTNNEGKSSKVFWNILVPIVVGVIVVAVCVWLGLQ